ncbi:ABC transporter ATP-binding protein [Nitrogeniibacter aestuarii]|uniref:ABC transporter ATP-binding protein n=1 Tax=Nitrogeniibacter aestuarii TaxID=2815343 RepID=UPI001D10ABCB|nr:ABC transporter ATP-binding protein [Nitrogeniibacter aestuarii]
MDARVRPAQSLYTLSGVRKTFRLGETRIQALRGVDLDILAGDFLAIWGPSGSGKSTLLNMLGLIDAPDEGRVVFDGQTVGGMTDDALSDCRNQKIGFVFQNFNLIPVLSALENVMLPLQLQGVGRADARERAARWLKHVGLERLMAFRPDTLSGGQRQRVAIARALVGEPRVVIADEPTANLDSVTSHEIIDLLELLNRKTGVTCIFTTHDPRLLDRVPHQLCLEDGEVSANRFVEVGT